VPAEVKKKAKPIPWSNLKRNKRGLKLFTNTYPSEARNITLPPKSINFRLPYLSIKKETKGREPKEVTPKEPIIKPMVASSPPSLLMKSGSRKKEEKLQKKKKFAMVIREKFLNSALLNPEIIFGTKV